MNQAKILFRKKWSISVRSFSFLTALITRAPQSVVNAIATSDRAWSVVHKWVTTTRQGRKAYYAAFMRHWALLKRPPQNTRPRFALSSKKK